MLTYEPDDTIAHRLDPRSKIGVQMGFAVAALAQTTPFALVILSGVTVLGLASARVSPIRAIHAFRFPILILIAAPIVSAITLESPWFVLGNAVIPALASYRVGLILLISAAFVRSTAPRESRAAIQQTVPGKPGQLLGTGVAIIFRLLPVMQADLQTIRNAHDTRLGTERPIRTRLGHIGVAGIRQAFRRADRLAIALQARCYSWNPTHPPLAFTKIDVIPVLLTIGLVGSVII